MSLVVSLQSPMTFAVEYRDAEVVPPQTAQESSLGMEDTDRPRRLLPRRYVLTELLAHRGAFWADSGVELRLRAYDFTREIDGTTVSDAAALGTELTFRSGRWQDRVSVLASWHTSFGLHAPDDLGGTGILGPDQSNLSVLSRAYTEIHLIERASVRLYRQDFNLPYLNRNDSRMIPNTHEAYIARRPGDRFEFLAGYVTKMKTRESERFVHMGEVAGVSGSKSGTSIVSARASPTEKISVGLTGLFTRDLFSTVYAETSYKRALDERWGLQLAAQYSWQGSQGDEALGDFNTSTWGIRAAVSYRAAVLTLARTGVDDDAPIRSPFGGQPSFTKGMIYDFDRAGENAWRARISQNFARFGMPGLSLEVDYTEGRDAISARGEPLGRERAWSVTADFQAQKGFLQGLWLRLRYGDGDREGAGQDERELRLILNYTLRALR
jgi:hypothetical protein